MKLQDLRRLQILGQSCEIELRFRQGCEFALSLIRSLLFRSKSLILKSDREWFAHVALYIRATVSDALKSLFTMSDVSKSFSSLFKMSDVSVPLWFEQIACKIWVNRSKNSYLSYVFPLFMPRSESLPSLFAHSLFFKELPELKPFAPVALEKSDREQFSQAAYDKKAIGVIPSFSWANRSFAHKKQVNRSKNQWSNSQPWL